MAGKGPQFINPSGLNDPSALYTHVVTVPPGGTTVYISGQYGADEAGNLVSGGFAAQVKQTFANLRTALAAAGARPEDVVKITVLIVDYSPDHLPVLRAERNAMWGDRKPASTLIGVQRLAFEGMQFELEAVAVIP